MRAGIYVRVSTREQAEEGYSIQAQLNRLRAFCESQGWSVSGVYADQGESAKDTNRPQLQQMLKDIENKKIDVVLVYRLDRLTRSVYDLYRLLETFDKNECGFKSATEVYDTTTAMGRLFITIVAALAQWEREDLGENVAMGMEEKASQGKFPGGFAPFGFDVKDDKLIPNKEEAEIVRKMYELYASGKSMNDVVKYLNNNNKRSARNNYWHRSTVRTVLKSQYVRGHIYWKGKVYKDTHAALVDKQISDQVSRLLKRNTSRTSSTSNDYIFSSILKCSSCGFNLHGNKTTNNVRTHYSYRCSMRRIGRCNGTNTSVAESRLEVEFIKELEKIDFTQVIEEMNLKQKNDDQERKKELENELVQIEKRRKKWQFAWVNEIITSDDLRKRMKEEDDKKKDVINELEELSEVEEVEFDEEEVKKLLSDIRGNWNVLKRHEKKELVQSVVDSIEYTKEGHEVIIKQIKFIS